MNRRCTLLRCHGSIAADRMAEEEKVDRVPPSDIEIIEVEDFVPLDLIVPVLRQDGNRCECGLWQFYSAVCGHLYQTYDSKCGGTRNKKNTRTIFCPKTASRLLISPYQVNAACPYPECQSAAEE